MEAVTVTKNQIIEQLARSSHGKLEAYRPIVLAAAKAEPEFLAHFIAWNQQNGAIRDSKLAVPVCSLAEPTFAAKLAENSYAHLALQDPRSFVKALEFAREVGVPGHNRRLAALVQAYLRGREASFGLWERAVIQHRASIKTLYAKWHVKPGAEIFQKALFLGQAPAGSTLDIIRRLPTMEPKEALGHVLNRKIPFLIAVGALGSKLKDSDAVLALIQSASDAEIVTNAKMLDRLGTRSNPALRAAFRGRLDKLGREDVKMSAVPPLLKATRAAEALGDGATATMLKHAQERQLKAHGGVKGRWLICGDKSGSMAQGIEACRFIAGHLAKLAEDVKLIFYDTTPRGLDCTGKTLDWINEQTQHVQAGGGTVAAVCLEVLRVNKIEVDGIVIVTDCEDNRPDLFAEWWKKYTATIGAEPTLYIFQVGLGKNTLAPVLEREGILTELYDMRGKELDYYSLPNLLATLQTKRWGLIDQIMETPLKTLEEVFDARHST